RATSALARAAISPSREYWFESVMGREHTAAAGGRVIGTRDNHKYAHDRAHRLAAIFFAHGAFMTAPSDVSGSPYGTLPPASPLPQRRPVSLPRLAQMRQAEEKITMLTAYDATFAAVADAAGVECILVGDSLGMVCQGLPSTVGVTLESVAYHTASVARGLQRVQGTAWLVADLPYGTYAESREQALRSACSLMQAGAHMVKLEGGGWTAPTVEFLVRRGVPVCARLGLTQQTAHALGCYRVQGKTDDGARTLRKEAHELQDAGAAMLVLEMVPAALAADITAELPHCHSICI